MDAISTATSVSSSAGTAATGSLADLGGGDFLELLIMQLRQQDPLEPMDNTDLLQQISSIRDIELSTTLNDSLRSLTEQQRLTSVSSFIGQYVTASADDSGAAPAGLVTGVRFTDRGQPILQLSSGEEVALDQVSTVQSPRMAAEVLIGRSVLGLDRRDPADPQVVEGVVTGVKVETTGDVSLELDTGEDLRLRDVVRVVPVETA